MNPVLLNLLERAGWTFLQALAGTIVATDTVGQFNWQLALVAAVGATALSVMKTLSVQATVNSGQVVIAPTAMPAAPTVAQVVGQAVPATSVAMAEVLGPRHAAARGGASPVSGASVAGLSATAEFERPRF